MTNFYVATKFRRVNPQRTYRRHPFPRRFPLPSYIQDKILKPLLIAVEADLEAHPEIKASMLAAASAAGMTAESAVVALVLNVLKKEPVLAPFMPFVQGSIKDALAKLLGAGLSEVDVMYAAMLAAMKHEISVL